MSHNKRFTDSVGVCSAIIGSSTLATKAQRALMQQHIQSSIKKSTTSSGCVYTVTFPCIMKAQAEVILAAHGITPKGYL